MALSDILLPSEDQYMQFELLDGSLYVPLDITSDANGIIELPYISASTGIDITSDSMISERTPDDIKIFIDVDGRLAIRLDKQLIKIID
jgi:hypothetical protein